MLPRIFIGGTGRSGTSLLNRIMGCHEAIYSFSEEMRFLTDPDGIINLLDALTIHSSVFQAREALYRFERLMRVYLANPQIVPYRGWDMACWLGGNYYWQRLDRFCAELTEGEFIGAESVEIVPEYEGRLIEWAKRLRKYIKRIQRKPFVPARLTLPRMQESAQHLKVVKYFSDRSELAKLAAGFVDDLFLYPAREKGKQTWCEKTPPNILYADFLWELFPESIIIHIKRDPRGVVHSHTKVPWAPGDLRMACLFLKGIYERWFDVRNSTDLNKYRYLEIKLEELAASPVTVLDEITSFCGLENRFENLPDIALNKVEYWRNTMTNQEIQLVNQLLSTHIEEMGYEV